MNGFSRRSVLGGAAAAIGAPAFASVADPRSADLIVRNARVYTMEAGAPTAQAFAVRDGRIAAVGSNDAIARLGGKGTDVFDARGMTVVPGFID
ncbi:MAG: amidohydrolase, partial [Gemmatimonadetes bacterium]|nr:amidohydrolase [Gemmatimonadota bacterium]